MNSIITIKRGGLQATIYYGTLASIKKDGTEFMHGASKPWERQGAEDKTGWRHSELVMFPVFGPSSRYEINIGGKNYQQGKHGIARYIPFAVDAPHGKNSVTFLQKHDGRSPIYRMTNELDKNISKELCYPHAYELEKRIWITPESVALEFNLVNNSSRPMNYMFGWKAAFKMLGDKREGLFELNNERISLEHIINRSAEEKTVIFEAKTPLKYTNIQAGKGIEISNIAFNYYSLWSPGESMFCIGQTTDKPLPENEQGYFDVRAFQLLNPKETKGYFVAIRIF